jgi:putative flippase GtrA
VLRTQNMLYGDFKKFVSFALFGLAAAGIDFFIYASLLWIGLDAILGNLISSSLGILINYFLVSNFTFNMDFKSFRNVIVFFSIAIATLFVSSFFLALLVKSLGFDPFLAKLVTLPLSAIVKYVLNRKYTFI